MKKIESRMQILKGLTLQRMWVQGRSSKSLGDSALSEQDLAELAITMADFDAAIKKVQPSVRREGFATTPDVTWDDVGALQEVRCLNVKIMLPLSFRPH